MLYMFLWIAVGIFAGFVTKAALPHSGVGGWMGDVCLGIFGACFGGWLVYSDHVAHATMDLALWGSIFSFASAAGLLVIVHMMSQMGTPTEEREPDPY